MSPNLYHVSPYPFNFAIVTHKLLGNKKPAVQAWPRLPFCTADKDEYEFAKWMDLALHPFTLKYSKKIVFITTHRAVAVQRRAKKFLHV